MFFKLAGVFVTAALLAGCGTAKDQFTSGGVSVQGIQPTLEQLNTPSTQEIQKKFIEDLVTKSGLTATPAPIDPTWQLVAEQGVYEISRQCDQYIYVLFRFNRDQQATRQILTATGAATATILGLAGVAAGPIAITAAAFGLAATTFDAGVHSVLYSMEPSALRHVVLQGQQKYLASIDFTTINSRPRLFIALQGYLNQCTPATIEANVNDAASGADSVSSTSNVVATRAAALAAPAATAILTTKFGPDANTRLLHAFMFNADGTLNTVNQGRLQAAMQRAGVTGVSSLAFINSGTFKTQRAAVVADLQLTN